NFTGENLVGDARLVHSDVLFHYVGNKQVFLNILQTCLHSNTTLVTLEVIYKRKKLRVKRTHVLGSLGILDEAGKYNVGDLISEGLSDFFLVDVSSTFKRTLDSTILTSSERIKKIRNVEPGQGEDDHDESYEIDNFFKSPSEKKSSNLFLQEKDNSVKKQQKSSNERGSNEADDEKDKVESEARDSIFISEENDDSGFFSLGSQPVSFCNASDTEDGSENKPFLVSEEEYAYLQEILNEGVNYKLPMNEIGEDVSIRKKAKKITKGTYSVEHPRSRNSEKSSFEVPSDENAKDPEDDEEIKFDLADISIELEKEPTCKWEVGCINVTDRFRQYQKEVIKRAEREGLKYDKIYELFVADSHINYDLPRMRGNEIPSDWKDRIWDTLMPVALMDGLEKYPMRHNASVPEILAYRFERSCVLIDAEEYFNSV
ncbi:11357_t:CDS:10, partial [Funneliformis caledonium]